MTNEAFCFESTNRERAILKRSAAHKRNGCKSKSCRLEVDKMSQKQIAKYHGPVMSWNMNSFYTYEDFLKMPDDLQVEWVDSIAQKYNVSIYAISKHMFGKNHQTLRKHFERSGLLEKLKHCQPNHIHTKQRETYLFKEAIAAWKRGDIDEEIEVNETSEEQNEQTVNLCKCIPPTMPNLETFSTSYISDSIDLGIISFVNTMFVGQKIRVSITVEKL